MSVTRRWIATAANNRETCTTTDLDMAAHLDTLGWDVDEVVRAVDYEAAVGRIRELEAALDKAADHLHGEGHYELSAEAYAPLETEWDPKP